jgi:hypothetical protein
MPIQTLAMLGNLRVERMVREDGPRFAHLKGSLRSVTLATLDTPAMQCSRTLHAPGTAPVGTPLYTQIICNDEWMATSDHRVIGIIHQRS